MTNECEDAAESIASRAAPDCDRRRAAHLKHMDAGLIALGAILGVAIGAVFDNVVMGIGIGLALAIAIGGELSARKRK